MRKEYYELHKEELKKKARERYYKNKNLILQQKKNNYTGQKREEILDKRRKSWFQNPSIKYNNDRYKKELQTEVFDLLGNKCNECGIDYTDILTIDHINNDGNEERKKISKFKMMSNIRNNINLDKYQILCYENSTS